MRRIQKAAVLGAGVMGSQIAAHLANAGGPVVLLDVTKAAADAGVAKLKKMNPAPYFVPENAALIRTGSFDDLEPLAHVDWIIEAIVEKLDVKQGGSEEKRSCIPWPRPPFLYCSAAIAPRDFWKEETLLC